MHEKNGERTTHVFLIVLIDMTEILDNLFVAQILERLFACER